MRKQKNKQLTNTNKRKFETIKPYLINSIITILLFTMALVINKVAPFGKFSLAVNDAFYQYQPMLYNFITSLKEGILSNYTFITSLGSSFFFNYIYYLSSPLNLLVIPFNNPVTMYVFIILIKIIFTSITTTFYVMKKTNNKILSTIISTSYVFSAWFLAYGGTIMWLDAFMMFPLFQYGLEKLLNEHKIYLFIFSLSYIMISNFYIAFMICLYTLIYFIYYVSTKKVTISHKLKNFNTISLATGITLLLSFWYIYITYDSFMTIGLYISKAVDDTTTISLLNMIKAFFSSSIILPLSTFGNIFPNIALNTIFTISLLYYFINKHISTKEKIINLVLFILIIFAFYSKTFNYIFNCFHVPAGFNFRYSFLVSFFLIKLFIRNYQTFNNKVYKRIYLINIILAMLLVLELIFKNIELKLFIFNIVTLAIFTLLFIFYKNHKIYKYIFTSVVIIEIAVSCIFHIKSTLVLDTTNYSFDNELHTYRESINYKTNTPYSLNFNLYENKNIIPYFSSMYYTKVLYDLETIGCQTDSKATIYACEETQLFKTFMNIKTNNDYYLEKIFTANNSIALYSLNEKYLIGNQNTLYEGLTGINNIYEQNLKKDKDTYKVTVDGNYYIIITDNIAVVINDEAYAYDKELVKDKGEITIHSDIPQLLMLNLKKNDKIEVFYNEKQMKKDKEKIPEQPYIYYYNEDKFKEAYNILKTGEIKYTTYESNKLEGTINVENNKMILTTIPYDTHWEIKIDGKRVEPIRIFDSLLGIETTPGKHNISMIYKTNFTIPVLISITTFIGLITKIIIDKRKQKKNEN